MELTDSLLTLPLGEGSLTLYKLLVVSARALCSWSPDEPNDC